MDCDNQSSASFYGGAVHLSLVHCPSSSKLLCDYSCEFLVGSTLIVANLGNGGSLLNLALLFKISERNVSKFYSLNDFRSFPKIFFD
jgi:hypothetical protein